MTTFAVQCECFVSAMVLFRQLLDGISFSSSYTITHTHDDAADDDDDDVDDDDDDDDDDFRQG